jgi:hypothetical protein
MFAPSANNVFNHLRKAAIWIGAILFGLVVNNYVNFQPVQESFTSQPCVECEWTSNLGVLLWRQLENGLVITAQEAGSSCCAMLGYGDNGEKMYCHSPQLKSKSGAYKGLQQFHCDSLQLFTFYEQLDFHCSNYPKRIVEIRNASLASAYTVAFALMSGFKCA